MFALLLIPNSLLAWGFLGQKPTRALPLGGAGRDRRDRPAVPPRAARQRRCAASDIAIGLGLTIVGLLGASAANVYQARQGSTAASAVRAAGLVDGDRRADRCVIAFVVAGPPVFEPRPGYWLGVVYLALFASVLCFSLYFPVVRKIGPGKAAYSSVLVPIIAMALSTGFEDYRWTALVDAGAVLALGGMVLALVGRPRPHACDRARRRLSRRAC